MSRVLLSRVLAILSVLSVVVLLVMGSMLKPEYSQVSNYISELSATGSAHANAFALAGFLPIAILLATFLFVAAPVIRLDGASRVGYWLLLSQPVAYIAAALAPCDPGCPMQGSTSQQIHNLLGLMTYIAGGAGLFLMASCNTLGRAAKAGLIAGGLAWCLSFALMPEPALTEWRGLLQRISEIVFWLVVLFIAFRLTDTESMASNRTAPDAPSASGSS